MRAPARLNTTHDPGVVCAQFGWWQACTALGLPAYAAEGPDTANYNAAIATEDADPVSGTVPLRSYLCQIVRAS